MNAEELKNLFSNINTWKRNGERAPHKPLLILSALGRLDRKEPRRVLFAEVKENLKHLKLADSRYNIVSNCNLFRSQS